MNALAEPRMSTLLIPVEIAARELDAKILLACRAAERGFETIVGCRFDLDLHADQLPRGIRLEKGVTDASFKMFRNLKDLGYTLAAWDEEALVYYNDHVYGETRYSARSAALVDCLMAWGDDNQRLWATGAGKKRPPIVVTGNPRADLLRSDFRSLYACAASEIRDAFGDFILINSNFGSVNFYDDGKETKFNRYVTRHGATELREHRLALFRAFLGIVPEIARAFPKATIIVRPHPAEDHRAWIETTATLQNVQVIYSGSVLPWLSAAAAVVHNGCTTAVEAFLMGVPALAYRPVVSTEWDVALPNRVSHEAFDRQALVGLLEARLSGRLDDAALLTRGHELLTEFIGARTGRLASDRILDAVEALRWDRSAGILGRVHRLLREGAMRRRRRRKLAELAAPAGRLLAAQRQRNFPPLTVVDLKSRIDALRTVIKGMPPLCVQEIRDNIFSLSVMRDEGEHGTAR
jgi:surface carbohydrate biosynthesis protein